jgi:hypothetical protein
MNSVQIEQKSYEMPPKEGISVAHFLTVADIDGGLGDFCLAGSPGFRVLCEGWGHHGLAAAQIPPHRRTKAPVQLRTPVRPR